MASAAAASSAESDHVAAPKPDAPPVTSALLVRNELEQAPVWVAEVDALTRSARALPLDRPFLNGHAMLLQMPCRAASAIEPGQTKQRSEFPGRTGSTARGWGVDPGPWTFSCWPPNRYATRP